MSVWRKPDKRPGNAFLERILATKSLILTL